MASRRHNHPPISYGDSGVDIDAGNALVEAIKPLAALTRRPGADADLGGFGALFDLKAAGLRDPILVAASDGVGTKLKIAIDTGRHATIGIDLVAMCVNDLLAQGAEPLFFLDYFAAGRLEVETARAVIAGVAEGCRQAGCALVGGETAEHADVMAPDDFDLAGFAVGIVEQGTQLGPERVVAGDLVVGLPSPGLRSNGYTLARHVLLERAGLELAAPAWDGADHTLADELLRPSVIYTPAVLRVRDALGGALHACAHVTGGGLVGNLPRILPEGSGAVLDRGAWDEPRVFAEIQRLGSVTEDEMDRVFNRGIGLALVVDARAVDDALRSLAETGPTAGVIGEVVAGEPGVRYR